MQASALKQFLGVVFKHNPPEALIGLSKLLAGKMTTRWYLPQFQNTLIEHATAGSVRVNTYVRITPVASKPTKGRGLEGDSLGSSVLWVDYDCYSHQLEGLEQLKSLPKPPTLIINSGKGLQAYWLLDRFYTELKEIKSRNKGLLALLDPEAGDSCYDLARVLRAPDTYNVKDPERPVLCTILLNEPDRVYSLNEFEPAQLNEVTIKAWDQEPVSDDFLDTIKSQDKKLYARIYSDETARKADVLLKETGEIDRSKNDFAIASGMLRLGYTGGEILTVLTHPSWLSGRKYVITGRYDYVVTTVSNALTAFEASPDRYFAKTTFQPLKVAEALSPPDAQDRAFLYANEQLYRYEEGWYQPNGEEWVRAKLVELLGKRWSAKAASEAITYIIDSSRVSSASLNNHEGLVNTKGGMIDINTGAIKLHSPKYLSLHQIPVQYDPQADPTEIDRFVGAILPADAVPVFWEYLGSCFLQSIYWPKAYLCLVGPGNTGKSKLLEWCYQFLGGDRNCAAFSLQALSDNRFTMGYLYGKIANVFTELDETEAKSVGQIKALTGDDVVTGEKKGKAPFHYKNTARLMFSANHYPSVRAPDNPFFERSYIIPCVKRFHNRPKEGERLADKDIVSKLSTPEHFSAGLNRALEGLKRLLAQNGLSTSPSIEAAQQEFRITADTVAGFLGACAYQPGYLISKQEMYQHYRNACELARRTPFSADKFFKRVQDIAQLYGIGEEYKEIGEARVWCYVNRRPNNDTIAATIKIAYPKEGDTHGG